MSGKYLIGDCLDVMREMDGETIDLVYADPPFFTNAVYHGTPGSAAEGVSFADRDFDNAEPPPAVAADFINMLPNKREASYLTFLTLRLAECRRLLRPTGSLYLHTPLRYAHFIRVCLDFMFNPSNYRNVIIWRRAPGQSNNNRRSYPAVVDCLLFYSKTADAYFDLPRKPRTAHNNKRYCRVNAEGRRYADTYSAHRGERRVKRRYYLDERKGIALNNLWDEPNLRFNSANRDINYPTEKPLPLLRRVVEASSRPGDVVLDPFAGSGTALIAAELLGRSWIGIEQNPAAEGVFNLKMQNKAGGLFAPPVASDANAPQQAQAAL